MARRIISEEEKNRIKNEKLYEAQKNKKFEYSLDDFAIVGGNWKHKNWKVWMKGTDNYSNTQKIIKKYIEECMKPYMKRDLSFIHLA